MMGPFPGLCCVPAFLPRSASAHLSVPSSSRVVGYVSAVRPVIRLPVFSTDLHSLLTAAFALGLTGLFPLVASSASVMRWIELCDNAQGKSIRKRIIKHIREFPTENRPQIRRK